VPVKQIRTFFLCQLSDSAMTSTALPPFVEALANPRARKSYEIATPDPTYPNAQPERKNPPPNEKGQ